MIAAIAGREAMLSRRAWCFGEKTAGHEQLQVACNRIGHCEAGFVGIIPSPASVNAHRLQIVRAALQGH